MYIHACGKMQVSFQSGQSSSVIVLHLASRDGSPTADVVYYVRLVDVLLSDADVIGCPASIGTVLFRFSYNSTVCCLVHVAYFVWLVDRQTPIKWHLFQDNLVSQHQKR